MTIHIGDVLRGITDAEFRSDVLVSDYWTEHNLGLLKHYIFTSQAASGKKCSVDLVRIFSEAYAPGATENRFVVIATYGHGKSHFALALANYFGKAYGTEEATAVLANIKHAIADNDQGVYGHIDAFRRQHQPYLVLLLRGDEPNDLQTKFYRALKEALSRDLGETGDSELPFWFKSAEAFLVNIAEIGPELHNQANRYLAQHQLDIDSLLRKVRERQTSAHGICVRLFQELYKAPPEFNAGLSMTDAVKWLVDNKCGHGKQYAGILVLFDEFSAFVANYCDAHQPGTPLQDLLNGIASCRERAAFVAFSQHDPDEVARRSSHGDKTTNVLKELDRLPKTRRYQLHSSLEEVLESFLRKRDEQWRALLHNDQPFRSGLDEATSQTLHAFKKRYLEDLKWDSDRFHSMVTLGCYPLHPMTTSMLCSVELQATASPRSLLEFIRQGVEAKSNEPVKTEAGPNWVRATSLADYFTDMLGEDYWRLYRGALSRVNLSDELDAVKVLQAMLLQSVGKVSTSGLGYSRIIAELVGVSPDAATRILAELTERSVIRRDPVTGNYTIAPTGWGEKGEKIAQVKTQQIKLDLATLDDLHDGLAELGFGHFGVALPWGHSDDWYADQILVERNSLTKSYVGGVLRRYVIWTLDTKMREMARGLVIWLIAGDEDDVEWYRNHLSALVKDVVGEESAPLIVMRPNAPSTVLMGRLKRYAAVKKFTNQERSEAEPGWYREAMEQSGKHLKAALTSFMNDCTPEVPAAFRARLAAVAPHNPTAILSEVIRMAYPYGPGRWFEQYKLTQPKLVSAVGAVCSALVHKGKVESGLLSDQPAKDIVVHYLKREWQLVDNTARVVQPPQSSAVRRGWMALDNSFEVGAASCSAKGVLEELLNPPFGYDWNTLALLFAAWWSLHRHDVEMTEGFSASALGAGIKPRDLLQKVSGCSIRRLKDPTGDIEQLLQDVETGRGRSRWEAQQQAQKLKDFLLRDGISLALKDRAREALGRLEDGLECARRYDEEAKRIQLDAQKASLTEMLSCLSRISSLPVSPLVAPELPSPDQVSNEVRQRVDQHVDKICALHGRLQQVEDFKSNLVQLQIAAQHLDKFGLVTCLDKVKNAVQTLEEARKDLHDKRRREDERRDQETVIDSLSSRGTISDLRRGLSKLDEMDPQPELAQLREQKRNAIAQELGRLVNFAESFDGCLDQATDGRAVSDLRDKALRSHSAFDETEIGILLGKGMSRCAILANFFGELEKVQQRVRFRPADFSKDTAEVQNLVAANAAHLSDGQRAAAERLADTLGNALTAQRKRVLQRLERHKQELARGTPPAKLQVDLERESSDWEFLPEDDASSLNGLRAQLVNRIEVARAKREEEARLAAERQIQEGLIKSLSTLGPISGITHALRTLDALPTQAELKPLWDKTHDALARELERLTSLPKALNANVDQATDRMAIETYRAQALQACSLCDEGEAQQSIQYIPPRCEAVGEYLQRIEQARRFDQSAPESFASGITAIRQLVDEKAKFLSDAHRAVADKAIAKLHGALSEKQEQSRKLLIGLQWELQQKQPVSKIQRSLDTTNWVFLPDDARDSLEKLQREVQTYVDNDEAQLVEVHFRKIREPELRRKCLEALQRLAEVET